MKTVFGRTLLLLLLAGLAVHLKAGTTRYVSQDNPNPTPPYNTWATAATNIQDAVDAAGDGDTVLVTNGVYTAGGRAVAGNMTNRVAIDRAITLQSVNGPEVTIIEGAAALGGGNGDGALRCAYLGNNTMLSGFTITNGHTRVSGDGATEQWGGGLWCEASAVVTNCILTGNSAALRGGGTCWGTFYNSILNGNSAGVRGGGSYRSTLYNCVLTNNSAVSYGGGAYKSALYACTLIGNHADEGGGVYGSTNYNCLLTENYVQDYSLGASAALDSYLYHCTVVRNYAACVTFPPMCTAALESCTAYNCIVYHNDGDNFNWEDTTFYNSCTTPLPSLGSGNIDNAPAFININSGNFRLLSISPCIDAGTDLSAHVTTDLDGRPRPLDGNGDTIPAFDMGAYEYLHPTADSNGDGIPDEWCERHGLHVLDPNVPAGNPDNDPYTTGQEWIADTDPTSPDSYFCIAAVSNGPPVSVYFQSSALRHYSLLCASNLPVNDPDPFEVWAPVPNQTDIPGTGGMMALVDTNTTTAGFYRVGVSWHPPLSINVQPQPQTVEVGENVTFSVAATGTEPLSFQWQFNGNNLTGATQANLTLTQVNPNHAGAYTVVVIDAFGAITSDPAVLTVQVLPIVINPQPRGRTVPAGNAVIFNMAATGSGTLSFQWRRNGTDLEGKTSSTLVLTDVQPAQAGDYTVAVTSEYDSTVSDAATLTVLTSPLITQQPQSQTIRQGDPVTFSVAATGRGVLRYQWQFNGTNLPGATTASLDIQDAQANHIGEYTVMVSDDNGTTTSDPATLVVLVIPDNPDPAHSVWITNGTYTMGSPATEAERHDKEIQHQVTISWGFWMGKYEVTQGDYLSVMGNNPSEFKTGTPPRDGGTGGPVADGPNHPVEHVTWHDATNYCGRLTALEQAAGRLPAGYEYRLPTESEWEYACRAGTTTALHYGHELRSGMANFAGAYEYDSRVGQIENPSGIYLGRTSPVGSYTPNAWGLYDMHGNVGEWCQDWFGTYPLGQVTDPWGPATGETRITRGGCFWFIAKNCRSAFRPSFGPNSATVYNGFRVVLARPQPLSITQHPQSQSVPIGGSATFNVTATGGWLFWYQWRLDGVAIPDATNASYSISSAAPAQAGDYTVEVSNGAESITSNPATLTVLVLPTIVVQPQGQTATVGDDVTLSVTVTNAATHPIGFRWRQNARTKFHEVLDVGYTSNLILTNVQLSDAGRYDVGITNAAGSRLSNRVMLEVQEP